MDDQNRPTRGRAGDKAPKGDKPAKATKPAKAEAGKGARPPRAAAVAAKPAREPREAKPEKAPSKAPRSRGGRGKASERRPEAAVEPQLDARSVTAEMPSHDSLPEVGTPGEALAAERLAAEAEQEIAAETSPPMPMLFVPPPSEGEAVEIEFDIAGATSQRRRYSLPPTEHPSDEALAAEYGEELGSMASVPIEGELVDSQTADEDRPLLQEIQGHGRERDRERHRRGRGRERGRERERHGRGRDGRDGQAQPQAQGARPPHGGQAPATPSSPPPVRAAAAPGPALHAGASTSVGPAVTEASSLADVGVAMLRSLPDARPVHVRQLSAMAAKRRLAQGDPEETWRSLQLALVDDVRVRQARGLRPRVRAHGSGNFALAAGRLDDELARTEEQLAQRVDSLVQETRVALRRRLTRLSPAALEAVARLYLDRAGYRQVERAKRVEQTTYLSAILKNGPIGRKILVGVRAGGDDVGRRAIGELRAGVTAKQHEGGLLLAPARLGGEGERELVNGAPPLTLLVGDAFAEALVAAGVGVVRTSVPVAYLDIDFLADLVEG